jgi:uncharacterized membrane protein YgcG
MLRALLLAVLLASLPRAAAADERILNFDAAVAVQPGGALEVTETIRVRAEGTAIRRGIYRDFPVEHAEPDGSVSLATFEVQTVLRDGAAEPWRVERMGAWRRLWIGDPGILLPVPSEQSYTIRYRTEGQLRAQPDLDELFWNVTGTDWAFPIDAASVTIALPAGVPILRHAAYTGPRGAQGAGYRVIAADGALYRARTTGPLPAGHGFSVAVAWPRGAIAFPPPRYAAMGRPPHRLAGRPLPPFAAWLATMIGVAALAIAWWRVGRDPPGGGIWPRFDPPPGLSPAGARFVRQQGFDDGCLTAAILSMAVKGAVRIDDVAGGGLLGGRVFRLRPTGMDGRALSPGETAAYRALFAEGAAPLDLETDKENGPRVDKARAALRGALQREHLGATFRRNRGHTVAAVAAGGAIGAVLIGAAANLSPAAVAIWGGGALAVMVLGSVLSAVLAPGRRVLSRLGSAAGLAIATFMAVVIARDSGAIDSVRDLLGPDAAAITAAAGAVYGLAIALFGRIMSAPTVAGRRLKDHLDGFALYMRTAEEDRLNRLTPPERTPELFERLLPYAVGLGLTQQWAAKFADVLTAATRPDWYDGIGSFDTDRFGRDFGGAVAAASAPAERSGGFSGGSGGGGGGGGGGGW